MRINIAGHHVNITKGISTAVNKQFNKLANHYPEIESINVTLTVEKHSQSAEAAVQFLGQRLVAKTQSADLYESITYLKNKIETLLKKRKATMKSHQHVKIAIADTALEVELENEDELYAA